ncbi:MAG: D-aminoacyl-tRNA deacylase, partial [Candidatus Cloacimonadota bacterium]|nr:D-aminoacyl-tRNA deacylase [Candidatus Cloacimonadota bacterium]
LRIYENEGKLNLSVKDIQGELLIISQFTLYANTKKGRRPDFNDAAHPQKAIELYENFLKKLQCTGLKIQTGEFGEDMKIHSVNDGPININIER